MYILCEGSFLVDDIIKSSKKATLKQTRSFSIVGFMLLLLGISFLIMKSVDQYDASFLIWILIICGLLIIFMPFILVAFLPKFIFNQNKSLAHGFDYKYEFFDDSFSVSITSPNSKTNNIFSYDVIYKVTMSEDIIYLYLNSNVTYMIKKDSFKDEEECNLALLKFRRKPKKETK